MRLPLRPHLAALVIVAGFATPAAAIVVPGDVAPNFTKNQLDYPSLGQVTPRRRPHADPLVAHRCLGARLAPGVYLVRARIGARILVHRAVVLP